MVSTAGGSVCVETSLITMPGRLGTAGSSQPGVPFTTLPALQLAARPHVARAAFGLTIDSANPDPSVTGYHSSLYVKSRTGSSTDPRRTTRSPALLRFPVYVPRTRFVVP